MGLFKPAWMIAEKDVGSIKKWQAACECIRQAGPDELRLIAVKAPARAARREAFSRMSAGQLALILGELDSEDASAAESRMVSLAVTGDPAAVSAVQGEKLSAEVLKMIRDSGTVRRMKQNGMPGTATVSPGQRGELLGHVSDPGILSDIARNAKNEQVRYEAALKAQDNDALFALARSAEELTVQFNAAARIRDPQLRMRILASPEAFINARRGAVSGFSAGQLRDVILNDALPEDSRTAAAEALFGRSGSEDMIDAFLADENMPLQVRIEAAMVTKDISLLEKIAAGGGETKLRRAALECITDHNVLRRIRDEVPDLREAACERLGHDTEYAGTEKIGGDTFKVFRCRICGRESRMPAE